jgi:hypothetical protein
MWNSMKYFIALLVILTLDSFIVNSQTRFELGIKPTQFLFKDFEGNFAIDYKRTLVGVILSYRPATQDSGEVKGGGSGTAGGYDLQNMYNNIYRAYTAGLYQKTYFTRDTRFFFETDLFYRNWNFKNKPAEYRNVEAYRFKGMRTENVNVYGLKLLVGQTFKFNRNNKLKPFIDLYTGLGIRYKQSVYITTKGFIYDIYFDYKKDVFNAILPSFHFGIKAGLLRSK